MKIIIGYDKRGIEYASILEETFKDNSKSFFSIHYPEVVREVVQHIDDKSYGILICNTGIGMSIAANRYKHIRAALIYDNYSAEMSRKHNNANVLCIGSSFILKTHLLELVNIFLTSTFEGGRHEIRLNMIHKY